MRRGVDLQNCEDNGDVDEDSEDVDDSGDEGVAHQGRVESEASEE